jgi:hypothetical protein
MEGVERVGGRSKVPDVGYALGKRRNVVME